MTIDEINNEICNYTPTGQANKVIEILDALKRHLELEADDAEAIFDEIKQGIGYLEQQDFFGTEGLIR